MVSRTARDMLCLFTLLHLANFVLVNAPLPLPFYIGPCLQLIFLLSLYPVSLPCHSAGCCMHHKYYVKLTSVQCQFYHVYFSSHDLLGRLTSACRCTVFTPKCPIYFVCRTKNTRPEIVCVCVCESECVIEWVRGVRERERECASVNKVSHLTRKHIKVVTCCYSVQCGAWVSHTWYETAKHYCNCQLRCGFTRGWPYFHRGCPKLYHHMMTCSLLKISHSHIM